MGIKIGKAPGPNGISNRFLSHLPKRRITFVMKVFGAVIRRQYFSPPWKHVRLVYILKPGKEPTLPFSDKSICLLDPVGNFFENILFSRVLRKAKERRLQRDERLVIRPRHSTTPNLARFFKTVNRNFQRGG
jgi:hypothetical protein